VYNIILSFITAFTLTYFAIPSIIHIARVKHLCDDPDDDRRAHTESTPSLGGIGIFAGVIFSIIMWTPFNVFSDLQYILCSFIIMFLIGAKDDILPMSPRTKLMGEVFAAAILVFLSHVQLTSFYGFLGIYELPYAISIAISIFTILVIINAFNLIDGINGLSGSLAVIMSVAFGTWFFFVDRLELAIVAYTLAGASLAFLKYNYSPAKIFMGDTGSLLLGLIASILAIKFLEVNDFINQDSSTFEKYGKYAFPVGPAIAIGILVLPLFDTLRVFTKRAMKGQSPFHPDRTHIHHMLLDYGFSHMKSTFVLVVTNIFFILVAIYFQFLGPFKLIVLILVIAIILSTILNIASQKKVEQRKLTA